MVRNPGPLAVSGQPDVTTWGKAPRRRADMLELISTMRNREDGQALVEYTLIIALICLVSIALLDAVGQNVTDLLSRVSDALASAI